MMINPTNHFNKLKALIISEIHSVVHILMDLLQMRCFILFKKKRKKEE